MDGGESDCRSLRPSSEYDLVCRTSAKFTGPDEKQSVNAACIVASLTIYADRRAHYIMMVMCLENDVLS